MRRVGSVNECNGSRAIRYDDDVGSNCVKGIPGLGERNISTGHRKAGTTLSAPDSHMDLRGVGVRKEPPACD